MRGCPIVPGSRRRRKGIARETCPATQATSRSLWQWKKRCFSQLSHTSSLSDRDAQAVFQVNCSRSGCATHAAVLVLYYCVSLGVIF